MIGLQALTVTLLRLLGLYILVTGLPQILWMIIQILQAQADRVGPSSMSTVLIMTIGTTLSANLIGAALILYSKSLSALMIPDSTKPDLTVSLDLQAAARVGIGLIGAGLIALNLPWFLARLAESAYRLSDPQRSNLDVWSYPNTFDHLMAVILGLIFFSLAFRARPFLRDTGPTPREEVSQPTPASQNTEQS